MQADHENGEGDAEDDPANALFFLSVDDAGGCISHHGAAMTFTKTFRMRGPSNSQKKMDCQVPRTSWPFSNRTVSDAPIMDALTWAAELPSPCR